jgi:hypothetical protein
MRGEACRGRWKIYWHELLVDTNLIAAERLCLLQDECNQLLSIFVTSIENKKEILNS